MISRFLRGLWSDEDGATAVEYGLIAGLISVAIIGSLRVVNTRLIDAYTYISSTLSGSLQ